MTRPAEDPQTGSDENSLGRAGTSVRRPPQHAGDPGTRPMATTALDPEFVDAVIFDMDGVLADTASLHASVWKLTFDEFLSGRSAQSGQEAVFFEENEDYLRYVDGRVRQDGVSAFLASRGIALAFGDPSDPAENDTVWGLANRENEAFLVAIAEHGVRPFASSVALIHDLRARGVANAVVSASRNALPVLEAAGIAGLFDARVCGDEASRSDLPGRLAPATFLEAARRLGVVPSRAVVVEDALAGVAAGHRGGFGLVVGVARNADPDALRTRGADVVIRDLSELRVLDTNGCCTTAVGPDADRWVLESDGFDSTHQGHSEALCTLGNGYMGTRGALSEAVDDGVNYPGTYVAGTYNRLVSQLEGSTVEDESLVNAPNWLPLTFYIVEGEWFGSSAWELLEHHQHLDLRHGILTRRSRARDVHGHIFVVAEHRIVSMEDPHLAAIEWTLVPENWSGPVHIRSGLDGQVRNRNVGEYDLLANRHLDVISGSEVDAETILLEVETSQSHIRIAEAARTRIRHARGLEPQRRFDNDGDGSVALEMTVGAREHEPLVIEKVVAIYTSRDHAISEPGLASARRALDAPGFASLLAGHRRAWDRLWSRSRFDIETDARTARSLHLHLFHIYQTLSPHTTELDAGVPARGLHGEGYRGHIFWDELFVYPVLNIRFPGLTRALLLYRYRRLDEARRLASVAGYRGALFPWQSASTGREETPTTLFNTRSNRWMPDNSHRQRHVSLAIAYNVWQYHQVTNDIDFLRSFGAELLVEIARFWASIASPTIDHERYDIVGVMGPDEFHDGTVDAPGSGVTNNAYTNVMVAWLLWRTRQALDILNDHHCGELWDRLQIRPEELEQWNDIGRKLNVAFLPNGIIEQFEGYGDLAELDWEHYRARYGDIGRLDLILEAEHDTPNRYQLSKQADVLMLFYLLSAEELTEILTRLGYDFDPSTIPTAIDYYLARTSHGSTLSHVVHSWVLARRDRSASWPVLLEALATDLDDSQHGTTAEGVHLGAMAGTVDILQRGYAGLELRDGTLRLNPRLPSELPRLALEVVYRGQFLGIDITHDDVTLQTTSCDQAPVRVAVADQVIMMPPGSKRTMRYPK
jgi:HAD superfamily hydrolase (TIGR01509 family)